ncbi:hypothetical protein [Streptomyces sp. NPDC093261]|uniref:hypothetical protein n=1 Tax=Streptomyces sp. NPDC093261 TaxID=3366037 RepID=UPI003808C5F6
MFDDDIDTNYLRVTCRFCPTQLEGETPDGRHVYFRYRWGVASVDIDGEHVWSERLGDDYDGVMDTDEAKRIAASVAAGFVPVRPS